MRRSVLSVPHRLAGLDRDICESNFETCLLERSAAKVPITARGAAENNDDIGSRQFRRICDRVWIIREPGLRRHRRAYGMAEQVDRGAQAVGDCEIIVASGARRGDLVSRREKGDARAPRYGQFVMVGCRCC